MVVVGVGLGVLKAHAVGADGVNQLPAEELARKLRSSKTGQHSVGGSEMYRKNHGVLLVKKRPPPASPRMYLKVQL